MVVSKKKPLFRKSTAGADDRSARGQTSSAKDRRETKRGEARRILVVEDDPSIVFGLERNLSFEGYEVIVATDGETGLTEALDSQVDLIILDIMLPKINGYEICQTIRKRGLKTPVIFLSARIREIDKVTGLDLGGDDYMTKPFGIRELVARVKSNLRRIQEEEEALLESGPLRIDVAGHVVYRKGRPVELTSKEFKLLKYLVERKGQVLRREDILDHVWGFDYDGTSRTVDNFINRIRQKIGDDLQKPTCILTVRGVGYKFATG